MKKLTVLALLPALFLCTSCDGTGAPVDVPQKDRVERKEWDQMTPDEKVEFIKKTPMSEEAKQKRISQIQSGGQ